MALEIERKLLIANSSWKNFIIRSIRIRDGLIASNNDHAELGHLRARPIAAELRFR